MKPFTISSRKTSSNTGALLTQISVLERHSRKLQKLHPCFEVPGDHRFFHQEWRSLQKRVHRLPLLDLIKSSSLSQLVLKKILQKEYSINHCNDQIFKMKMAKESKHRPRNSIINYKTFYKEDKIFNLEQVKSQFKHKVTQ